MASSIPQRYIDGLNSADVNAVSELFSQGSQFLGGDGSKRGSARRSCSTGRSRDTDASLVVLRRSRLYILV